MSYQEATNRSLMKAASKAPYLEREEEQQLAIQWIEQKDQQALNKLTSAHMRLVIAIATKFRRYGLPTSDLVQEGHVGLLEAAARFDPHREVRFSTYATWWIRASMQDYILRNWSIVRSGTSSGQKSLFFNLRHLRNKISKSEKFTTQQDMHKELARAIGVSVKDVATMDARLSGPDVSLNAPVATDDDTGAERQDYLATPGPLLEEAVTEMMDDERRKNWIASALKVLNERELRIINQRKLTDKSATLEQLGSEFGISKERVRQLETRALAKLKKTMLEENPAITKLI